MTKFRVVEHVKRMAVGLLAGSAVVATLLAVVAVAINYPEAGFLLVMGVMFLGACYGLGCSVLDSYRSRKP